MNDKDEYILAGSDTTYTKGYDISPIELLYRIKRRFHNLKIHDDGSWEDLDNAGNKGSPTLHGDQLEHLLWYLRMGDG